MASAARYENRAGNFIFTPSASGLSNQSPTNSWAHRTGLRGSFSGRVRQDELTCDAAMRQACLEYGYTVTMMLRRVIVILILLSLDATTVVWGFAEESLGWRDPATGVTYSPSSGYPEISTMHADLTYALALAAGFTTTDSKTLQVWNQLTSNNSILDAGALSSWLSMAGCQ